MNKWYFLHRWNTKSHQCSAELEGRFTSQAQAVSYLREMAGEDRKGGHGLSPVRLGKPAKGVLRYDITLPDGTVEKWAIKVRPLRIEDINPPEPDEEAA